jgi:hypothetical protein
VFEGVQTGIRVERRLLKVLKITAELKDVSLGDLLEASSCHAFEVKPAFRGKLKQIGEFKATYSLSLRATDHLQERKRHSKRE